MAAIEQILSLVRPFVRNCPDEVLTKWTIEAARNFCQKSRYRRWAYVIPTTSGVSTYALQTPTSQEEVTGLYRAQYGNNPLRPSAPEENLQEIGTPRAFWFYPSKEIVLSPTPVETSATALAVTVLLQPLLTATELDDELVLRYDHAIADGAKWRLFSMPGAGWANPDRVEFHMQAEMTAIRLARYEADRGHRHTSFHSIPGF